MTGHLWVLIENKKFYKVVTKSNNEEAAKNAFRKQMGSSLYELDVEYVGFVSVVET